MSSGTRARQKRQQATGAAGNPPPGRSENAPGTPRGPRRAASRVFWSSAGILALAAVAAIVTAGSPNAAAVTPPHVSLRNALRNGLPGAKAVYSMFKGIPQHGNVLGSPKAPVTMIEYIDLQCPYCREFETHVMPAIVRHYVRTGKVRVVVRPLAFIGPDSVRGRAAMIAAGEQGKAFNLAQMLYDNQQTENTGWLGQTMVHDAASSIPGMNVAKLVRDERSSHVSQRGRAFDAVAAAANVDHTPTLDVGRTGRRPAYVNISSPTDKAALVAAIHAALGT